MTVQLSQDADTRFATIGRKGAVTRIERAKVRHDLLTGAITLTELFAAPPASITRMTVFDVLRMLRVHRHANRWEHRLGQNALTADVNLFVRVENASDATKCWAVEHGQWYARRPPRKVAA